jgi:ABC-type nitrate/sulfonate/bicarbonate transport system permease component
MKRYSWLNTVAWQALICVVVLSIWQWGYDLRTRLPWLVPDLLDPYFISKPSQIFENFLVQSCLTSKLGAWNGWLNGDFAKCLARNQNNLWVATGVTLQNTFFGFVTGVISGFVAGLILGRSDRLSAIFQPFITAVNSIPRIALAPIIVLAFGIGDMSKIVTSWIVVVFLVFFNTFEGARSIDEGFTNAARLLGASEWLCAAAITPRARLSLPAKTALGRSAQPSTLSPAAFPSSMPNPVSMIHFGLGVSPASESARVAPARRPTAVEVNSGPGMTAMSVWPRSSRWRTAR